MAVEAGRNGVIHVTVSSASKLRKVERESGKMDPYVVVRLGELEAASVPIQDGGTSTKFDFSASFPWNHETTITFIARDANDRMTDEQIGRGKVWLEDLEYRSWSGVVELCTELGEPAGRMQVEIRFSGEADSLREYAGRLAEVVMEQHAARRQDWSQFQSELQGRDRDWQAEVVEFRELSNYWREEYQQAMTGGLEADLRAERRRRIDLEARLTELEESASMSNWHLSSQELREARNQLQHARLQEDSAVRSEMKAEDRIQHLRQELSRVAAASSREHAEVQLQAQHREAEVLGRAWQISGELRTELDTCRGERQRQGLVLDGPRHTSGDGIQSARQALQQLRGVRERYNGLLNELPQ